MKINPVQIGNIFLVLNCLIYASDTMKVDSSQLYSTDIKDTSSISIPTLLNNLESSPEEDIFDDQMSEAKSIFAEAIISDLTGDTLEAAYQLELLFESLANMEVLSQDDEFQTLKDKFAQGKADAMKRDQELGRSID